MELLMIFGAGLEWLLITYGEYIPWIVGGGVLLIGGWIGLRRWRRRFRITR